MTMAYSSFKGATGKHGWRITHRSRLALKEYMARQRRKRRRVTTPPRYTKAHHGKQPVRNRFSSNSWR